MKKALLSVSDKTNLHELAKELVALGYEIVSSGGTAKYLEENGIKVTRVSEITDFPEIMNGRVKTLHPKIHGGILADRDIEEHLEQAKKLDIEMFDFVVVNLYPFAETLKNNSDNHALIIENIDIGGPTLVRSAAKNYKHVGIIVDPADYDYIITELQERKELSIQTKTELALKAFEHTANYDSIISGYFQNVTNVNLPETYLPAGKKLTDLRYGENPHQTAAIYNGNDEMPITQHHGKQLSYNNYLDIDSALRVLYKMKDYDKAVVAILKHLNPCGIGIGVTISEAYDKAFATDTLSPFGGIVVTNKTIDLPDAEKINSIFTEIIIAPDYTEEAMKKLKRKKNRRLITVDMDKLSIMESQKKIITCMNGYLVQDADLTPDNEENWQVVTETKPDAEYMDALRFGWKTVSTLKSNAVCFTTHDRTLGLGIGQTSRIDSTEIAVSKAGKFGLKLEGSICASDGFFPFRDSADKMAELGIKGIIQPGGSNGDEEVIKACNEHGIFMIFTGTRHFRH